LLSIVTEGIAGAFHRLVFYLKSKLMPLRNLSAVLMAVWVLVVGPGLCLAEIGDHRGMCDEGSRLACESDPHHPQPAHGPHGGPGDPCRSEVCRFEQDDLSACVHSPKFARDTVFPSLLSAIPINRIAAKSASVQVGKCPHAPPDGADIRSTLALPLLI
jgi:hypothetical protein